MDRRIYDTGITATRLSEDSIRVHTESHRMFADKKHTLMPKEWFFLEQILDTLLEDENPVTAILRVANGYKGYG